METNTTKSPGEKSELATSFAALKAEYFKAHEAYSSRPESMEPKIHEIDPAYNTFIKCESALRVAEAPDFAAVLDKLYILLAAREGDEDTEHDIRSIIADVARLSGADQFNPGLWLFRWTSYNGGYVVQDGNVKLISPADNGNGHRAKLLAELDSMGGKEAINSFIVDKETSREGKTDIWQTLRNTLARATANAAQPTDDDEVCDRLADKQLKALQGLMLHPAPDMTAFSYKMEAFIEHDCGSYSDHIKGPIMEALLSDTRRLSVAARH